MKFFLAGEWFNSTDEMALLLPGDVLYPSDTPGEGPTRVVLSQGRWWSREVRG